MSFMIDHVTMPPKSLEASNMQVNEINKMNQDTQHLQAEFQNVVQQNQEKTIRREKAENKELKNEEEKRRRQGKKKKKQEEEDSDTDEKKDEKPHFDMMI